MRHSINDADWIDPEAAEKFKKLGIKSCASLLDAGASLKGRKQLACATGLDERQILHWTNTADRLRIKGIGVPYAQLLHYAGVDTINALKYRNPGRLAQAMAEQNAKRKLVRSLPSEKVVKRWIDAAKKLPLKVTYK
jgi:hypothetical protein